MNSHFLKRVIANLLSKKAYLLFCLFGIAQIVLQGCKKENYIAKESILSKSELQAAKLNAEKQFGKTLLIAFNNSPNLKLFLKDLCLKQETGDYATRINTFLNEGLQQGIIAKNDHQELTTAYNNLKKVSQNENPIIFIPSVEEIEFPKKDGIKKITSTSDDLEILVPGDEIPGGLDVYPGYIVDQDDNLQFYSMISEEIAWENDVIVIGYEEVVSAENQIKNPLDTITVFRDFRPTSPMISRTVGREEHGGILQVTNLGEIESWVNGKLEFKYIVISQYGNELKNRPFGKIRRRNFRDQRWHDMLDLIGFWNTSNWGNWTYEKWIEEDNGTPVNVTQVINPGPGLPVTTFSYTIKAEDDELGGSIVQFTDPVLPEPIVTTYTILYMNFRRRTN